MDDHSGCLWVLLFTEKSQVSLLVKIFINYVQNQFHTTAKTLRSDNGTEFTNIDLQTFLASLGIIHQTSCAYTPQQIGTIERKHQHMSNVVGAFKLQSIIPITLGRLQFSGYSCHQSYSH